MEEIREIIGKKYTLERELAAWRAEAQRLEEDVPQKVWALREAKMTLVEYESGLRGFFDKFSGKRTEKVEALEREIRKAKGELDYTRQQLEQAKASVADLEEQAGQLPSREELFAKYPDLEYLKQQDTLCCCERILRLLRENEKCLLEARDWAVNRNAEYRGHPYGTQYDKTVLLNQGAVCAREICAQLQQICQCGYELEIHTYFRAPDGFIAGAARQYGQLDRINYALQAVSNAQSMIRELMLQLG